MRFSTSYIQFDWHFMQLVIVICSKWKADRHSVECVCCYDNGSLLLSAGRAIKLWNLHDYSVIKVGGAIETTEHITII